MLHCKRWIWWHVNFVSIKLLFFKKLWPALLTWWWEHKNVFRSVIKYIHHCQIFCFSSVQCHSLYKIPQLYLVEFRSSHMVCFDQGYLERNGSSNFLRAGAWLTIAPFSLCQDDPHGRCCQYLPQSHMFFCTYYFCTCAILSNCWHMWISPECFLWPLESPMSIYWADWTCQGLSTTMSTPPLGSRRENSGAYCLNWYPRFPGLIKCQLPSAVTCLVRKLSWLSSFSCITSPPPPRSGDCLPNNLLSLNLHLVVCFLGNAK